MHILIKLFILVQVPQDINAKTGIVSSEIALSARIKTPKVGHVWILTEQFL